MRSVLFRSVLFIALCALALVSVSVSASDDIDFNEPATEVPRHAPNEVLFPADGMTEAQAQTQLTQIINTVKAEEEAKHANAAGHAMHAMTVTPDFTPCQKKCKLMECAPSGEGAVGFAEVLRIAHDKYALGVLLIGKHKHTTQWEGGKGGDNGCSMCFSLSFLCPLLSPSPSFPLSSRCVHPSDLGRLDHSRYFEQPVHSHRWCPPRLLQR